MQQQYHTIVNSLRDKIEELKRLYENEISKNKQLKAENIELNHKIKDQNIINNKLQTENNSLKFSLSIVTGDNVHEAKSKINKIVREIDKCIALLNK